MRDALPYVIHPSEPGAQAKFYLPKKTLYQHGLYETLTRGFDIETVRDHFRDPVKKPRIEALIRGHGIELLEPESIIQTFWGYSLYEIDGVFKTRDQRRRGQVDDERVQVVRMIFRPDMEEVLNFQPDQASARQLCAAMVGGGSLSAAGLERLEPQSDPDHRALAHLGNFLASVRLFFVGFFMFEICDRLLELNQSIGQKLEDEIWITLAPNMMINRFVIPEQSGG